MVYYNLLNRNKLYNCVITCFDSYLSKYYRTNKSSSFLNLEKQKFW